MEVSLKATGESNLSRKIVGSLYYMQQIIGLCMFMTALATDWKHSIAFLWQQMLGRSLAYF